ncbi:unnamed protein product [Haemonchus placei]|uniref:SPX domain-containing protein n=1 Tax=Haemonchus placei TaxID=6290 RepID=A0A0N4WX18_HAEPC|nr:unnamed protein product [Haemonchus placei]
MSLAPGFTAHWRLVCKAQEERLTMNGRKVSDYTPLRHDLPLESESDSCTTTDGYYSDLNGDDTSEKGHCQNCLSKELFEKKISDLDAAIQAAQQIALANAEQYKKAFLKRQGISEKYEELKKELNRALYLLGEVLFKEDQVSRLRVDFLVGRHPQLFTKLAGAPTFPK